MDRETFDTVKNETATTSANLFLTTSFMLCLKIVCEIFFLCSFKKKKKIHNRSIPSQPECEPSSASVYAKENFCQVSTIQTLFTRLRVWACVRVYYHIGLVCVCVCFRVNRIVEMLRRGIIRSPSLYKIHSVWTYLCYIPHQRLCVSQKRALVWVYLLWLCALAHQPASQLSSIWEPVRFRCNSKRRADTPPQHRREKEATAIVLQWYSNFHSSHTGAHYILCHWIRGWVGQWQRYCTWKTEKSSWVACVVVVGLVCVRANRFEKLLDVPNIFGIHRAMFSSPIDKMASAHCGCCEATTATTTNAGLNAKNIRQRSIFISISSNGLWIELRRTTSTQLGVRHTVYCVLDAYVMQLHSVISTKLFSLPLFWPWNGTS